MSRPTVVDVRAGLGPDRLDAVVAHVRAGGVVAHPTETVYGLGALATPDGVAAVRAAKPGREERPFLVLVPGEATVASLVWTEEARALARRFWPGAVTLVLADPARTFPAGVRSEAGGVAVRVTSHPITGALVDRLGGAFISTSANAPGEPPAASGDEVVAVARAAGADAGLWVLDAGRLPPSPASTVVDCTGPRPRVVRVGATTVPQLRSVLPGIDGDR